MGSALRYDSIPRDKSAVAGTMLIRPILQPEIEQARLLLVENDWGSRVSDPLVFARLVEKSQIALVAVEQEKIVGFLRAISDGVFNGYISMVVIAASHRRRGIGAALVNAAMGDDLRMTWVLRTGRVGAADFYKSLGFSRSELAMERPGVRDAFSS